MAEKIVTDLGMNFIEKKYPSANPVKSSRDER
jgi:hypothetical protein